MTNAEKQEILDEIKKHKHCVDWCENRDYAAGYVNALSWCEGLLNMSKEETCIWEKTDNMYSTECSDTLYVDDDFDWKYCPICGKKIIVKERSD